MNIIFNDEPFADKWTQICCQYEKVLLELLTICTYVIYKQFTHIRTIFYTIISMICR